MEIIIKENEKLDFENYKIGDLFKIECSGEYVSGVSIYILTFEQGDYLLREMGSDNWQGLNGRHNSIHSLFTRDNDKIEVLEHYSRDDYELHLVRK